MTPDAYDRLFEGDLDAPPTPETGGWLGLLARVGAHYRESLEDGLPAVLLEALDLEEPAFEEGSIRLAAADVERRFPSHYVAADVRLALGIDKHGPFALLEEAPGAVTLGGIPLPPGERVRVPIPTPPETLKITLDGVPLVLPAEDA